MKLIAFRQHGQTCLGAVHGEEVVNLTAAGGPASLDEALAAGVAGMAALEAAMQKSQERLPLASIKELLPPVLAPGKAIAVGLNYIDHAAEGNHEVPAFPVLFSRYPTSWVGHDQPIIHPKVTKALDYEGEMVIVIGKSGRYIAKDDALAHVAGYSIFNEGSVRDYQMRTHQWTIGKNFDRSGSFGPWMVTADELPAGAKGLRLQTILNGKVMQDANTDDMIFDVATLVSICSEAFELQPGDIIISGTPSGVGGAQKPPVFLLPGDVCQVSIEGIGVLTNTVEVEPGS
jgi:2-keto-4-pentenoate hydratase/2-oxohepta-3-ene-1,7-dioic acid hydratase in catechol pathway